MEQLSAQSVSHLAEHCQELRELTLENCVFYFDQNENIELDNVQNMLNLKKLTILNFIPNEMFLFLVSKALNLEMLVLDAFVDVTAKIILQVLDKNKLIKLHSFVVYSSKLVFLTML